LFHNDHPGHVFDEYCYDPQKDSSSSEDLLSEDKEKPRIDDLHHISIVHI